MYVHTREYMNSLLINDFALHIIEILFASNFLQALMFQAFTGKIPGSKPVVRAEIILTVDFRLSLSLCWQFPVYYFKWRHCRFLSCPAQFIIHSSFQHSTRYEPCYINPIHIRS